MLLFILLHYQVALQGVGGLRTVQTGQYAVRERVGGPIEEHACYCCLHPPRCDSHQSVEVRCTIFHYCLFFTIFYEMNCSLNLLCFPLIFKYISNTCSFLFLPIFPSLLSLFVPVCSTRSWAFLSLARLFHRELPPLCTPVFALASVQMRYAV